MPPSCDRLCSEGRPCSRLGLRASSTQLDFTFLSAATALQVAACGDDVAERLQHDDVGIGTGISLWRWVSQSQSDSRTHAERRIPKRTRVMLVVGVSVIAVVDDVGT